MFLFKSLTTIRRESESLNLPNPKLGHNPNFGTDWKKVSSPELLHHLNVLSKAYCDPPNKAHQAGEYLKRGIYYKQK